MRGQLGVLHLAVLARAVLSAPFGQQEGSEDILHDQPCPQAAAAMGDFVCQPLPPSSLPPTPPAAKMWPSPQKMTEGPGGQQAIGLAENFEFSPRDAHAMHRNVSSVLKSALLRSCALLAFAPAADVRIEQLEIVIRGTAPFPPQHGEMDEGYTLSVQAPHAHLIADTQYGALRGIQTFSQLFDAPGGAVVQASLPLTIEDKPFYPWRGVHLDVARHFFDLGIISRTLDAMSMQKLNVLHLHLVDAQSFPLVLESHPELAGKGAWGKGLVYTGEGLRSLVAHAALLGIRIVPEIDVPGHTAGFGMSHPEVITYCQKKLVQEAKAASDKPLTTEQIGLGFKVDSKLGNFNMMGLKLRDNRTFELVADVFRELTSIFPDRYVHIGADEVDFDCLAEDAGQQAQLQELRTSVRPAFNQFVTNAVRLVRGLGRVPVMWEDSSGANAALPAELRAAVQTWKGWAGGCCGASYAKKAIREKVAPVIQSSNLYLDWNLKWAKLWSGEPNGNGIFWGNDAAADPRNLGVEVCAWTEQMDEHNMECRMWPRTSVVAEQAWIGLAASLAQQKAAACIPGGEHNACKDGRLEALLERLQRLGVKPQGQMATFYNWQCKQDKSIDHNHMPLDFLEKKWGTTYEKAVNRSRLPEQPQQPAN